MTYIKMSDEMKEFEKSCYDPMREFSQKVEEEAAASYWKMFFKMLIIQLCMAFGVVVTCSIAMSNLILGWRQIEFSLTDVLQMLKIMYYIQITASLVLLGLTQAQSSEFVSWQMRAGGSNLIGTMLKILDKLCYCESRLQDMQGFWTDTNRQLDNATTDGLDGGQSWDLIRSQWCRQMRKIYEQKGCATEIRQKFKQTFEKIQVWVRDEYIVAWHADIMAEKVTNVDESLKFLENAKIVLKEMETWVATVEFLEMPDIEDMIQGNDS